MPKYVLNIKGETIEVTGKKFAMIVLPTLAIALILMGWGLYTLYLTTVTLAAQLGVSAWLVGPALLVLLGRITTNGQSRGLLPAWVQQGIGAALIFWTAVHLHEVGGWAAWQTFLLTLPVVIYIAKLYLKPSA